MTTVPSYWDFDESKASMRTADIVSDTIKQMMQMEEDARLHVVVGFLREKGYTIAEPGLAQTANERHERVTDGDYIPRTENVRLGYAYRQNLPKGQRHHPPLLDEFDRWLLAHDAEVLRTASVTDAQVEAAYWELQRGGTNRRSVRSALEAARAATDAS